MVCRDETPVNPQIRFSLEEDRTPSARFDFGIFDDRLVYVFVDGPSSIVEVDWYLDDVYARTEFFCPYDLAGTYTDPDLRPAKPLDTSNFAIGLHQIRAEVLFVDGSTTTVTAWWFKL